MTDVTDWTILEVEGVMQVAERTAQRVAREWAPTFEYEDLLQEAYLMLATDDDLREALSFEGLGVLRHRLWTNLTDYARKVNRRTHLNLSYDEMLEGDAE